MRNYLLSFLTLILFISCKSSETFYETGELKMKGKMVDQLKNGQWKYYHQNGKIYQMGSFKDDKETGLWKIYHENEALRQIGNFKEGKQDGQWLFYHDNGNKEGVGNLASGKMIGKWIWYHSNGNLYTERLYEDGNLMEILSCYDGKGNPLEKGTLKKGTGSLNSYDIDGNLIDVQNFENGKIKS